MDERINKILRSPWAIPAAVGVISFGSGVGVGFILGRREKVTPEVYIPEPDNGQLEIDWSSNGQEAEEYAPEDSGSYSDEEGEEDGGVRREVPVSSPEFQDRVRDFVSAKLEGSIKEHQAPDPEPQELVHNVFGSNEDGWSYEDEIRNRSTEQPYVLHRDEFWAEEEGYSQITLTYYEGDDILTDEEDAPVYNYKQVVGELKFGHGSTDPNVFYVRNDKRRCEYEVLRHEGLYSEEVLGIEIEHNTRVRDEKRANELKHSRARLE